MFKHQNFSCQVDLALLQSNSFLSFLFLYYISLHLPLNILQSLTTVFVYLLFVITCILKSNPPDFLFPHTTIWHIESRLMLTFSCHGNCGQYNIVLHPIFLPDLSLPCFCLSSTSLCLNFLTWMHRTVSLAAIETKHISFSKAISSLRAWKSYSCCHPQFICPFI